MVKGILFKPDMIQAIIEGRKTQTRRVINPQPNKGLRIACYTVDDKPIDWVLADEDGDPIDAPCPNPRYQVGETVYIKEAWCESYYGEPICYKADGGESPGPKGFWRSPMFLKAVNARYFLKITGVRAERFQEITEKDAKAEGVERPIFNSGDAGYFYDYRGFTRGFCNLWDSINPMYPWEMNPWVWVYSFEKV